MVPISQVSVQVQLQRSREDKKTNHNNRQKMLKPYSNHVISVNGGEEDLYEEVGKKKAIPIYTELDQIKREQDADALYQHLVKK